MITVEFVLLVTVIGALFLIWWEIRRIANATEILVVKQESLIYETAEQIAALDREFVERLKQDAELGNASLQKD